MKSEAETAEMSQEEHSNVQCNGVHVEHPYPSGLQAALLDIKCKPNYYQDREDGPVLRHNCEYLYMDRPQPDDIEDRYAECLKKDDYVAALVGAEEPPDVLLNWAMMKKPNGEREEVEMARLKCCAFRNAPGMAGDEDKVGGALAVITYIPRNEQYRLHLIIQERTAEFIVNEKDDRSRCCWRKEASSSSRSSTHKMETYMSVTTLNTSLFHVSGRTIDQVIAKEAEKTEERCCYCSRSLSWFSLAPFGLKKHIAGDCLPTNWSQEWGGEANFGKEQRFQKSILSIMDEDSLSNYMSRPESHAGKMMFRDLDKHKRATVRRQVRGIDLVVRDSCTNSIKASFIVAGKDVGPRQFFNFVSQLQSLCTVPPPMAKGETWHQWSLGVPLLETRGIDHGEISRIRLGATCASIAVFGKALLQAFLLLILIVVVPLEFLSCCCLYPWVSSWIFTRTRKARAFERKVAYIFCLIFVLTIIISVSVSVATNNSGNDVSYYYYSHDYTSPPSPSPPPPWWS